MSRRTFKPTAEQRGWVEAMIGYGIPEAEIRLLIKHPQTGKPISLQMLRRHFAEEIATGAVKAKALIGDRIIAWILGRDGDLQDDRARVRLAILFARARMGWTAANCPQQVCDPSDTEDARRSLDAKIARLAKSQGWRD
jgi:hypothetical protein